MLSSVMAFIFIQNQLDESYITNLTCMVRLLVSIMTNRWQKSFASALRDTEKILRDKMQNITYIVRGILCMHLCSMLQSENERICIWFWSKMFSYSHRSSVADFYMTVLFDISPSTCKRICIVIK